MFEAVKDVLTDWLMIPPELVIPEATPEDAGIDSLTLVELSLAIQKDMGVSIGESELVRARTIGEIADIIEARVAGE